MSPDTDQLAVLIEVATLLTRHGTPYALIGGIAVGLHSGIPRATLDIDLAVPSDTDRPAPTKAGEPGAIAYFDLRCSTPSSGSGPARASR